MERSVCFLGMEINMKKRGQTAGIILFLAALAYLSGNVVPGIRLSSDGRDPGWDGKADD